MDVIDNNMDFIDMFEQKLCDYTGSKYAVCCDCCTNAILISLYLKVMLKEFDKSTPILVPSRTYMSVPMTLKLFGFNVMLDDIGWEQHYYLMNANNRQSLGVIDAAVDFRQGVMCDFTDRDLVCLSFQQKKRLNLGRGGAILTNNREYYIILKRLVYDGRNPKISDKYEVLTTPENILLGFHMYMEPEKAARGIMLLNQQNILPNYQIITSESYPDLKSLRKW